MKKFLTLLIATFCLSFGTMAQNTQNNKGTQQVTLDVPGYCCHKMDPIIEKSLAYGKGVVEWTLDNEHKQVTVVYKTKKTNPETIAKDLALAGVRTSGHAPTAKAIQKLPTCCQAAAQGKPSHCGERHSDHSGCSDKH